MVDHLGAVDAPTDGPGVWAAVSAHLPAWTVGVVGALLLVAWLASQLKPIAPVVRWVIRPVRRLLRLGGTDRELVGRRRALAASVLRQLEILAEDTRWDDRRYTELQAEVEIEGREMVLPWWSHSPERTVAKRSVSSLTRALGRSLEKIVVLQGEPGSGKSVALRHLATELAHRAAREAEPRTPLPFYLDLKRFRPDGPVSSDAVHAFVLDTLRGIGDQRVSGVLDQDLDRGLADGHWLLLFDSFDEIPAVLAATESDAVVRAYADAIITYVKLGGCRAVVASREWRGPPTFQVKCFTVKRLDPRQQRTMIQRSGLDREMRQIAVAGVTRPDPALQPMVDNPLFLWLLCDYLGRERGFPESVHEVFDSYVRNRFTADEHRTSTRFGFGSETLRAYAEEIAFCVAARPELGLEPSRGALRAAITEEGRLSAGRFDQVLDALTTLRLGREPNAGQPAAERRFTFTHRRLQEYFATCMVQRAPGRVAIEALLSDGHWRETAIALLQTQSADSAGPLLAAAERLLEDKVTAPEPEATGLFRWPPGLLHVLEVVTIGLNRVPDRIPAGIRDAVGPLLTRAWTDGRRHDQLWVLGVVLAAPPDVLQTTLSRALESSSALLRETAYRFAGWLPELPGGIQIGIRRTLFAMWSSGQLRAMAPVIRAQLGRLRAAPDLGAVYRLLRFVSVIDVVLLAGLGVLVGTQSRLADGQWLPAIAVGVAVAHSGLLVRRNGLAGAVELERSQPLLAWTRWLTRSALTSRIIGRLLRLAVAGLAIIALIRAGHVPPLALVVDGLAIAYGISWADAAMDQVLLGGRITTRNWPLLPLTWAFFRREGPGLLDQRVAGFATLLATGVAVILGIAVTGIAMGLAGAGLFWLGGALSIDKLLAWIWYPFGTFFGWIGQGLSYLAPPDWVWTIVLAVLGGAVGILMLGIAFSLVYVIFSPLWFAGATAMANRRVLRSAARRTTPYSAQEILTALDGMGTGRAVRDFVGLLRESPALCGHGATVVLSDVATAAAAGGHQRYQPRLVDKGRTVQKEIPAEVSIPDGCSPWFTAWARTQAKHAADLLLRIDDDTVDEITRLVAGQLRPLV